MNLEPHAPLTRRLAGPAGAPPRRPRPRVAAARPRRQAGGEANLKIPDLSQSRVAGMSGRALLMLGLAVCVLGLVFGLVIFGQLKNLPVHESMREISELIYETCKTYLITQGKFILLLEVFIGDHHDPVLRLPAALRGQSRSSIILLFSLIGIAGSYGVAWFGIRINTFANSRTAFASLRGQAFPVYAIPLKAGMAIGMLLISVELFLMLCILLFIPGDYAGPCFIGFAIGESLGAAALRIAGGIFTKIADIGSDLMKIVFNIKEDDARNPGVIADCTGDNAGDSVGPSADGFETYGVTGVALISFILLAVREPAVQVQLLVWIFVMRVLMIVASGASYLINEAVARGRYASATRMNFEAPLTSLVWLTSIVSVVTDLRRLLRPHPRPRRRHAVVEALHRDHLRDAGRRHHPRAGQDLHLDRVGPRPRGGDVLARGRGLAQRPVGLRGRQLQRVLAGDGHRRADGHRVRWSARSGWARSWWRRPCSPSAWWRSASSAWAR